MKKKKVIEYLSMVEDGFGCTPSPLTFGGAPLEQGELFVTMDESDDSESQEESGIEYINLFQ